MTEEREDAGLEAAPVGATETARPDTGESGDTTGDGPDERALQETAAVTDPEPDQPDPESGPATAPQTVCLRLVRSGLSTIRGPDARSLGETGVTLKRWPQLLVGPHASATIRVRVELCATVHRVAPAATPRSRQRPAPAARFGRPGRRRRSASWCRDPARALARVEQDRLHDVVRHAVAAERVERVHGVEHLARLVRRH